MLLKCQVDFSMKLGTQWFVWPKIGGSGQLAAKATKPKQTKNGATPTETMDSKKKF